MSPTCRPGFGAGAEALAWFEAERANLAAVAAAAAERDRPHHCWQLVQTSWRFYVFRGHVHDWIRTHRLALRVVQALDDPVAEAEIRKNLGLGLWRSGDLDEALGEHRRALALDRASEGPRASWRDFDRIPRTGVLRRLLEPKTPWGRPFCLLP